MAAAAASVVSSPAAAGAGTGSLPTTRVLRKFSIPAKYVVRAGECCAVLAGCGLWAALQVARRMLRLDDPKRSSGGSFFYSFGEGAIDPDKVTFPVIGEATTEAKKEEEERVKAVVEVSQKAMRFSMESVPVSSYTIVQGMILPAPMKGLVSNCRTLCGPHVAGLVDLAKTHGQVLEADKLLTALSRLDELKERVQKELARSGAFRLSARRDGSPYSLILVGSRMYVDCCRTKEGDPILFRSSEGKSLNYVFGVDLETGVMRRVVSVSYRGYDPEPDVIRWLYKKGTKIAPILVDVSYGGKRRILTADLGKDIWDETVEKRVGFSVFSWVINTVELLHSLGLAHCDLKNENVMEGGEVVDFSDVAIPGVFSFLKRGTSCFFDPHKAQMMLTGSCPAKEADWTEYHGDVWALAMLIASIKFIPLFVDTWGEKVKGKKVGSLEYQQVDRELFTEITSLPESWFKEQIPEDVAAQFPPGLVDLLNEMLQPDHRKRPKMEEVKARYRC